MRGQVRKICRSWIGAGLLVATSASADTIGYWRFEGDATDSSGNGLTLVKSVGPGPGETTPAIQNLGTTEGGYPRGTYFYDPVPQGALNNDQMTRVRQLSTWKVDDAAVFSSISGALTIELMFNTSYIEANATRVMASQWGTSDNQRSWAFCVRNDASDTKLRFLASANGAATDYLDSDFTLNIVTNRDYYAAAVFENTGSQSQVTFYLQDLTGSGSLLSTTKTFSSAFNLYNSTAPFRVGASSQGTSNQDAGLIFGGDSTKGAWVDEVRLSSSALTGDQLYVVPEPAMMGVLALGAVLLRVRRRLGVR